MKGYVWTLHQDFQDKVKIWGTGKERDLVSHRHDYVNLGSVHNPRVLVTCASQMTCLYAAWLVPTTSCEPSTTLPHICSPSTLAKRHVWISYISFYTPQMDILHYRSQDLGLHTSKIQCSYWYSFSIWPILSSWNSYMCFPMFVNFRIQPSGSLTRVKQTRCT